MRDLLSKHSKSGVIGDIADLRAFRSGVIERRKSLKKCIDPLMTDINERFFYKKMFFSGNC